RGSRIGLSPRCWRGRCSARLCATVSSQRRRVPQPMEGTAPRFRMPSESYPDAQDAAERWRSAGGLERSKRDSQNLIISGDVIGSQLDFRVAASEAHEALLPWGA